MPDWILYVVAYLAVGALFAGFIHDKGDPQINSIFAGLIWPLTACVFIGALVREMVAPRG